MFPSRLIFLSQKAQPGQVGGHVALPRPILFLNYCHLSVGLGDKKQDKPPAGGFLLIDHFPISTLATTLLK